MPVLALPLPGCKNKQAAEPATDQTQTTDQSDTTADTTLAGVLPSSLDTKLTTNLNLATNAAHAWHPDAVLVYASVEIPASLIPNAGNEVYVYGAASDLSNWWTYSVSEDTGKFVRAIIPREDYLGSLLDPVNTSYWKMNFVEAFQAAEKNGGGDFRTQNAGTRVTTFLSQRAPRGWLWWTVEYTAPSGEQFTLLVNPNQGEVVNENGDQLAPGAQDQSSLEAAPATSADTLTTPTN